MLLFSASPDELERRIAKAYCPVYHDSIPADMPEPIRRFRRIEWQALTGNVRGDATELGHGVSAKVYRMGTPFSSFFFCLRLYLVFLAMRLHGAPVAVKIYVDTSSPTKIFALFAREVTKRRTQTETEKREAKTLEGRVKIELIFFGLRSLCWRCLVTRMFVSTSDMA